MSKSYRSALVFANAVTLGTKVVKESTGHETVSDASGSNDNIRDVISARLINELRRRDAMRKGA